MSAGGPIASNPVAYIAAILNGDIGMALVVEDGTGIEDANSFVSLTEMKNYFAAQPRSLYLYSDETIEGRLISAAYILSWRFKWCGKRTTKIQALAFPRTGSRDQDNASVGSNEIPDYLKIAQYELAYWLLINSDKTGFESSSDQSIGTYKEIEIFQGIRIEYADAPKFDAVPSIISELVKPCGILSGKSGTYFIERS